MCEKSKSDIEKLFGTQAEWCKYRALFTLWVFHASHFSCSLIIAKKPRNGFVVRSTMSPSLMESRRSFFGPWTTVFLCTLQTNINCFRSMNRHFVFHWARSSSLVSMSCRLKSDSTTRKTDQKKSSSANGIDVLWIFSDQVSLLHLKFILFHRRRSRTLKSALAICTSAKTRDWITHWAGRWWSTTRPSMFRRMTFWNATRNSSPTESSDGMTTWDVRTILNHFCPQLLNNTFFSWRRFEKAWRCCWCWNAWNWFRGRGVWSVIYRWWKRTKVHGSKRWVEITWDFLFFETIIFGSTL